VLNKRHIEDHRIVGAVGSIIVEHAVGLVWRRELWGANIRFVNFNVLEEVFIWVSSWLSMSRQGVGVICHSSVPLDCLTIVAGEVVLMEMG
jgi:hypothetical protein